MEALVQQVAGEHAEAPIPVRVTDAGIETDGHESWLGSNRACHVILNPASIVPVCCPIELQAIADWQGDICPQRSAVFRCSGQGLAFRLDQTGSVLGEARVAGLDDTWAGRDVIGKLGVRISEASIQAELGADAPSCIHFKAIRA